MIEKSLLTEVIGLAYGKGLDLAEIYVEEKQSSNILMEDNRIEKIHSGREKGAGIRVVKDYAESVILRESSSLLSRLTPFFNIL